MKTTRLRTALGVSPVTSEEKAYTAIDAVRTAAGRQAQEEEDVDFAAGLGVAVREVPMNPGHARADGTAS